jgi:hypothetical protein
LDFGEALSFGSTSEKTRPEPSAAGTAGTERRRLSEIAVRASTCVFRVTVTSSAATDTLSAWTGASGRWRTVRPTPFFIATTQRPCWSPWATGSRDAEPRTSRSFSGPSLVTPPHSTSMVSDHTTPGVGSRPAQSRTAEKAPPACTFQASLLSRSIRVPSKVSVGMSTLRPWPSVALRRIDPPPGVKGRLLR